MNFSKKTRSLRIVMMDDESFVIEMLATVIRTSFKNVTILTFTNAKLAYQELMRETPDLFITDVYHPPPDGIEILRLLTEAKVKYPVLVVSGFAKAKDVLPYASRGLRVTFLSKPCSRDHFLKAMETALQIRASRAL